MHATRSRPSLTRAAACVSLLSTAAAVHAQELVLHVDDDAPPGGNGLSWASAYRRLNDALDRVQADVNANAHLSRVIRVAQGHYAPVAQNRPFELLSATTLLGGFAGIGSADPDSRDPSAFVTVLSGDVLGDDLPGFMNRMDNVWHVVRFDSYAGNTLDGVVVQGGRATNGDAGGGLVSYAYGATIIVRNCIIRDNEATYGGGMAIFAPNGLRMSNCLIEGNRGSRGGGAHVDGGIIDRCRFIGNTAGAGGAVAANNFYTTISNTLMSGNIATRGAAVAAYHSNTDIGNCTFQNRGATSGNAVFVAGQSRVRVWGSILSGDVPQTTVETQHGRLWLIRNLFESGIEPGAIASGFTGPNFGNIAGSPRFADPLGLDGVAGTLDDDLRPGTRSLALDAGATDQLVFPALVTGLDLSGNPRVLDDSGMPNVATGGASSLDIGAYEFQGTSCRADHDGDSVVSVPDIFAFLSDWFAESAEADTDRDNVHEVPDIFAFLAAWFAGC